MTWECWSEPDAAGARPISRPTLGEAHAVIGFRRSPPERLPEASRVSRSSNSAEHARRTVDGAVSGAKGVGRGQGSDGRALRLTALAGINADRAGTLLARIRQAVEQCRKALAMDRIL